MVALRCADSEVQAARYSGVKRNVKSDAYGDYCIAQALLVLESRLKRGPCMSNPSAVKEYLRLHLAPYEFEVFAVMWLDSQNNLIEFKELFRGTVNQTSVYPREVVREAMRVNASNCILAHNHPSGAVEPSRADEGLTVSLKSALTMIDVRVLDHIIVSKTSSLSMAERGLI